MGNFYAREKEERRPKGGEPGGWVPPSCEAHSPLRTVLLHPGCIEISKSQSSLGLAAHFWSFALLPRFGEPSNAMCQKSHGGKESDDVRVLSHARNDAVAASASAAAVSYNAVTSGVITSQKIIYTPQKQAAAEEGRKIEGKGGRQAGRG